MKHDLATVAHIFFCQALSGAKMQSLSTPIIGMLRTFIYTMGSKCVSVECGNKGITAVSLQCLMRKCVSEDEIVKK